ncbi:MAG: hypothetical protein L6Q54_12460 [Leptospiraceae bacterium]|nr:hypothetical protein [Leptospiraceae bacterium]MCK6382045.1 hypothetical protein [Leptospiraceae bacterium]
MTETQIKSLKKKFPELCEKCKVISENGKKFYVLAKTENMIHKFDKASSFVKFAKGLNDGF